MLNTLDGWLSIPTLLWLFPVVFMLHDFEEIVFIEGWLQKHGKAALPKVPARVRPAFLRIAEMTSAQFAVAVWLEFIVFIPITYLAVEKDFYLLFLACNAVMLLHVFTHLGQSLILGRYTPGVVTALLVSLPYSWYLFYRLLEEGLITLADIGVSIPIGLLVVPLVLFGHQLGRWIAPAGRTRG